MTEATKDELNWEPYVWRGTLGGAIGNIALVLLAAVYVTLSFGTDTLRELLVIGGVVGLLTGALAGLAIGFVIYKVTRKWEKQPSGALRFVIGSTCVCAYSLLTHQTNGRPSSLALTLAYAVLVGGLAGLMARAKSAHASAPSAASSA